MATFELKQQKSSLYYIVYSTCLSIWNVKRLICTTYINAVNVSSSAVVWFFGNPTAIHLSFLLRNRLGGSWHHHLVMVSSPAVARIRKITLGVPTNVHGCCSAMNNNECQVFALGFCYSLLQELG